MLLPVTNAVLIVNPKASGVDPDTVAAVTRTLAASHELEVHATRERGHATELAHELPDGVGRLYALGGDGLFNEIANGVGPTVGVGLLAGGASNVLPRALGVGGDALAAATRLAQSTTVRQISLGVANGRRFTFACGLGIDAELVRAIDARGRRGGRRPGDSAFAWELIKLIARRRLVLGPAMEVVGHGRAAFVIVGNGDPYTFAGQLGVHATPLARFEAGIDLVAPRKLGPLGMVELAWATLVRPGRQTRPSRYVYLHDVDGASVRCDRPTPLEVDGEDIGDVVELELRVERDAMTVLT